MKKDVDEKTGLPDVPPASPIIPSEATLKDAVALLRRALRKCRIEPADVVIMIPDDDLKNKIGKKWGLGEKIVEVCSDVYPNRNQFILRYLGVTFIGPGKKRTAEEDADDLKQLEAMGYDQRDVGV